MPAGVLFAFASYALYSCCDAIIKGLGHGLSVYEIAFFTTLFSLVPVFLTTPKNENWLYFWKLKNPWLVHMRGVSGVIGNACIIYAFVTSPPFGLFFAASAAWYRRFLRLSRPQQPKPQQRRSDGKTRTRK